MKEEKVNRWQIQEWYKKFKSVSIKTKIHELPRNLSLYRWVAYEGMATGRVRIGFFYIRTRPAGQAP